MLWVIAMAAHSHEEDGDIQVHSDVIRASSFSDAHVRGEEIIVLTFPKGPYYDHTLSVLPIVPTVYLGEIVANTEAAWKKFKKTLD